MEDLINQIPSDFAILWTLMLIVFLYVCFKFIPRVIKTLNKIRKHINDLENLSNAVKKNSEDIELIQCKIGRDFARLNTLEKLTIKQQEYIEESLEERKLILTSLLGVVQGLQEIGANGPTKVVESTIQQYLLKQAHRKTNELDSLRGQNNAK